MADAFLGSSGGPNQAGTGVPDIWFDGDDTTYGIVLGLGETTWDVGSAVEVAQVRIRWAYGGPFDPGAGASGAFDISVGPSITGPWTVVYDEPVDPAVTYGHPYPGDFEETFALDSVVTSRYWRFRSTTSGNNDIFTVEAIGPDAPPVDPGYDPPDSGHAILELYIHDEDASRWDVATWGDNDGIVEGTEGVWSGAAWQDVTPQGVNAHIRWGTSRPERGILAIQEAQDWLVTTYDPDRVLDPGNLDGPYWPQLVSGVPIRISSSGSGRVIRTGIVDRISYKYKAPEYRGQIRASSTIATAWRADVPEDAILGDTLRERLRDAVTASGVAIGGIPVLGNTSTVDEYPDLPLSPKLEGARRLWEHIYKAGEEVLWVVYEDNAGTLRVRPWGGPLDRGAIITYENLEDLEAASSEDGVYSVVRVNDETGTPVERVVAPLPRYGRRAYERDETTIDAEAWADAVLADRAWPGVLWTPGTVWCFDQADLDFMAGLEILERVTISVPGAVEITGRLLGMELWVQARDAERTQWLFLPRIATDGAVSLGGADLLVSDDGGDTLVADDGSGDYLEAD